MINKKEKQAASSPRSRSYSSSLAGHVGAIPTVPLSNELLVRSGYKVFWGRMLFKFMVLAVACAVAVLVLVSAGARDSEVFQRRDAEAEVQLQYEIMEGVDWLPNPNAPFRYSSNGRCFEDEAKVVVDGFIWCSAFDG